MIKILSIPAKEHPLSEATNVLDKEWDILIILDACRYDLFTSLSAEFMRLEDYKNYSHIISVASSTGEWFEKTFKGRNCKDIIYISGNPWINERCIAGDIAGQQNIGRNPFFKIVTAWKDKENIIHNTTHPESITKLAEYFMKVYPDKRLILHYMQPHFPYIGKHPIYQELWEPVRKEMFRLDKTIKGEQPRHPYPYKPQSSLWNVMKEGIITREDAWIGYRENLRLVMKELDTWKSFKGKKAITADHGECFLDYGIDGHPSGMRVEELVKVPWYEVK